MILRSALLLAVFGTLSLVDAPSARASGSPCAVYQSFFDDVYASHKAWMDGQASSGQGRNYYYFSYIFGGTLAMFEGTNDTKYLEQSLRWAETMIRSATIIDSKGKRNWAGTWSSPWSQDSIAYLLEDFQSAAELARLARIVLTDGSLRSVYGSRAERVYQFVKDHIVDKWLYARWTEWYFRSISADITRFYSDKTAYLVRMLLDLQLVRPDESYASLASQLLENFTDRLRSYTDSSLIWDLAVDPTGLDTSHANRFAYMVSDAYAAGVNVRGSHVSGLSNLLTRVIWNRSLSDPRFSNYVSGDNDVAFGRGAWGNGQIYSGWVALGAYDPTAQAVAEAVLKAIISGVRNPSLEYMSSVYGKVALSGFVVRNRHQLSGCF